MLLHGVQRTLSGLSAIVDAFCALELGPDGVESLAVVALGANQKDLHVSGGVFLR